MCQREGRGVMRPGKCVRGRGGRGGDQGNVSEEGEGT